MPPLDDVEGAPVEDEEDDRALRAGVAAVVVGTAAAVVGAALELLELLGLPELSDDAGAA